MPDWVGGWVRALGFPLFSLSPDPPDLLELLINDSKFSIVSIEYRVIWINLLLIYNRPTVLGILTVTYYMKSIMKPIS